jgi:hypothetical protein
MVVSFLETELKSSSRFFQSTPRSGEWEGRGGALEA